LRQSLRLLPVGDSDDLETLRALDDHDGGREGTRSEHPDCRPAGMETLDDGPNRSDGNEDQAAIGPGEGALESRGLTDHHRADLFPRCHRIGKGIEDRQR